MDFTKKEIQSAFWQLLEERPFGKITVKAVVARCGVNRNTFYYHFQDLRDLLRTSVLGWLDELFADGAGAAAVVAALSRRRAAVMHVYRSLPRETFIEELGVWVRYAVARCVGAGEGGLFAEKENRELLLSVCRFALAGFLLDWLEGDMSSDLGKSLSRCAELLKNFSLPPSLLIRKRVACDCGVGIACGAVEFPGKTEKLFFSLLLFLSFVVSSNCRLMLYHDKLLTEERCLWRP